MLRLVSPSRAEGQDPPKRRKGHRSAVLSLTHDEVRHLRASLKNIARAYGGMGVLAAVMGIPHGTLTNIGKQRPSGTLAIRLAQAGQTTVEAILTGSFNEAGKCSACGSRVASGRAAGGA